MADTTYTPSQPLRPWAAEWTMGNHLGDRLRHAVNGTRLGRQAAAEGATITCAADLDSFSMELATR